MDAIDYTQELKNRPRTWLVTGAAGFIGSHIAERLIEVDQKVVALDNFSSGYRNNLPSGVKFIEGDIRNADVCAAACNGVDVIIHQAAIGSVVKSIDDPVLVDSVNVGGALRLLSEAGKLGIKRFVYASSSAVYGDAGTDICVEEQDLLPKSPYAVTKRACELYADVIGKQHGICTTGLRYFNVYGARQDPNGAYAAVIPRWIDSVLSDQTIEIYGDGKTVRDFCYIDDVVDANIRAALADPSAVDGEVYNVASGSPTSLNELYEMICETVGKKASLPKYKNFRDGDIRFSCASIVKAKKDFGFCPKTNISAGLAQTVEWYKGR